MEVCLNGAQVVVAKPPVRESSTEGIYFFVWLDFRWIGSKPCSTQVYPEDMNFIKSQSMWVAVFVFPLCGCMCVSVCVCLCHRVCIQMQVEFEWTRENHANSLSYTNKKVDMFMQGAICGRQGLGMRREVD